MKVLIVGATSAIAEATARVWAARGDSLYLAARREALLQACAQDLRLRGASAVGFERFDVLDQASHDAMLRRAADFLGGIDCALLAHGTLADQAACASDPALAVREIELNGLGTAALVLRIAQRFREQGKGSIAVITSVAGMRGRASNYVYGSAKALVSTLLSGLRQELHASGITVVDIRPGFVDTPMTASFAKGPLWANPARIARDIAAGIDRGSAVVYAPWFWKWIMLVIRHIPEFVFVRMKL